MRKNGGPEFECLWFHYCMLPEYQGTLHWIAFFQNCAKQPCSPSKMAVIVNPVDGNQTLPFLLLGSQTTIQNVRYKQTIKN
jgi:hypothetical protein